MYRIRFLNVRGLIGIHREINYRRLRFDVKRAFSPFVDYRARTVFIFGRDRLRGGLSGKKKTKKNYGALFESKTDPVHKIEFRYSPYIV